MVSPRIIPNKNPKAIPGIALVFSYTDNDSILVPGLMESFFFCDFFVAYHDDGTDFAYDESQRHRLLIDTAVAHGATWVYLSQPTVRLGKGWRETMLRYYLLDRHIILHSPVYYFWDYSLDTIRTDFTKFKPACFFRVHPGMVFPTDKLHHIASPVYGERIQVAPVRYNLNRLGREVCIAKADYYSAKDGTPHASLRDFSGLKTTKINPESIRGLGVNELEYIDRIKQTYSCP